MSEDRQTNRTDPDPVAPVVGLGAAISRVVCIWVAAALPPLILGALFGPPSHSGLAGYLCVMLGYHLGLAIYLGFTGARGRSWWITLLGAIPLGAVPWVPAIVDDVATGRAPAIGALLERSQAIWF